MYLSIKLICKIQSDLMVPYDEMEHWYNWLDDDMPSTWYQIMTCTFLVLSWCQAGLE